MHLYTCMCYTCSAQLCVGDPIPKGDVEDAVNQ